VTSSSVRSYDSQMKRLVGVSETNLASVAEDSLASVEVDLTNELEVARCSGELPGAIGNVQRIVGDGKQPGCYRHARGVGFVDKEGFARLSHPMMLDTEDGIASHLRDAEDVGGKGASQVSSCCT
jgi:hypothetical protein